MKRRARTFKVVPEPAGKPSAVVARELGLPWCRTGTPRILAGCREWVSLPELGVNCLNAKLDTGARSSSLHAEEVEYDDARRLVRFVTIDHAGARVACEVPVVKRTRVKSSTGVARRRFFIETEACLAGGLRRRILLSLSNRKEMRCPMLLGREALAGFFLVDPQGSHLLGGAWTLEAGPGDAT